MNHTTFSWEAIQDKIARPYDSPIHKLIEYVMGSEMSDYLYPATMHRDLRIGRTANFSRADGELTIEYNETDDRVIFHYYDSVITKPWAKECRGKEIVLTFNHIVTKRLQWFKIGANLVVRPTQRVP